jgi:hypothetical protein
LEVGIDSSDEVNDQQIEEMHQSIIRVQPKKSSILMVAYLQ